MTTWIFQGNPNYFDITGYLRARTEIIWEARQKSGLMAMGDTVYMWRADGGKPGTGGVIARGTIVTLPEVIDDLAAVSFYPAPHKANAKKKAPRVKIHIDSMHLIHPVLTRGQAKKDPVLGGMHLMKVMVRTNYLLNAKEAKRLDDIYREAEHRENL
jgi:hypothetical protein